MNKFLQLIRLSFPRKRESRYHGFPIKAFGNGISPAYKIALFIFTIFFAFLSIGAWWEWRKEKKEEPAISEAPKKKQQIMSQSEDRGEEVEKIQTELKEVIARTRNLQGQVQNNRTEIQKILERAQIHEQILRTINVPRSLPSKQIQNTDEIIRREKLRLIAEDAAKTQAQLRTLQQTRSLKTTQAVSSRTKVSEVS